MENSKKKKIYGSLILIGFLSIGFSIFLTAPNLKKPLLKIGYVVLIASFAAMLFEIVKGSIKDNKNTLKADVESDFLRVNCTPACKANEICIKGACVEKEIKTPYYL